MKIMNKKAMSSGEKWALGVTVFLLIVAGIMFYLSKEPAGGNQTGPLMNLSITIGKSALKAVDSVSTSLFGETVGGAVKNIIGVKGTQESIYSFIWRFVIGFIAGFLGYLILKGTNFLNSLFRTSREERDIKLLRQRFGWDEEEEGSKSLNLIAGNLRSVFIFALIYATLTQIGIINRIIDIITLFYLTNWLIHTLMLTIIFVYGPAIIEEIAKIRREEKARKAVMQAKAGITILKSMGKS